MFENDLIIVLVLPLMSMSLKAYMLQRVESPLQEPEVCRIFQMIANGIEYCHRQGVVHCDLKLDNILVNIDDRD